MPKPWENAEGYHDPTAYHGTKNIIRDEDEQQKRVNTLIFVLKYNYEKSTSICNLDVRKSNILKCLWMNWMIFGRKFDWFEQVLF